MMANELLRRYVVDGSEAAFTELVRQHIDLVYSGALRQVNGDASAAEVDLTKDRGPFHLVLKPGKLLRLRAVDSKGHPLPKAYVWLNNMPPMRDMPGKTPPIQADFDERTDADGRVEWDSAPDDDLSFDVFASGYIRGHIHFRPDGNEHTITLSSGLTLSGSVTDAATGQPIPAFRIIVGRPTMNSITKEVSAAWSTLDPFWLKFEGGRFRHLFDEPASGDPNPDFIFKFEADGYASFITRSFSGAEGEVQLDVAMRPAAAINFAVLLPDGQPAVKADVGLVSPASGLVLRPGGFSHDNPQSGGSLLSTDDAGHVSLPVDETVKSIVIAHPNGFVQTTLAWLATNTTIQLQPWSRIEGTLLYDGEPAPGRDIQLQFGDGGLNSIYSDLDRYKATTDGAGRFVFPQAPPGSRELVLRVSFDGGWSNRPLTNLDIPPGETLTVTTTTSVPAATIITFPTPLRTSEPSGQ